MNPTNGSWWIVQILSNGRDKIIFFARAFPLPDRSREDLNNPPTAVTAVGGIFDFLCKAAESKTSVSVA